MSRPWVKGGSFVGPPWMTHGPTVMSWAIHGCLMGHTRAAHETVIRRTLVTHGSPVVSHVYLLRALGSPMQNP